MTADAAPSPSEEEIGPNLRRRGLGRELRKLRTEAKKNATEVGKYAGLTATSIRRIESGRQTILPRNVRLLCQFYGIDATLADHLVRRAETSNERGWWAMYSDTMPDWFEEFVGLESDAAELWNYSPLVIDGLLQTPEYADAFFQLKPDMPERSRAVELRQARQEWVHRPKKPTTLRVILDEGALRRMIGGPEVMRKQVEYLLEVGQKPNVALQVVPFGVGAHRGLQGPFGLVRFPDGFREMDAIYLENQRGALWHERPQDIDHFTALFEEISAAALNKQETMDFLDSLASSL